MGIKNYTTSIKAEKSAFEIQEKLSKSGAQAVLCEYDNQILSSISFRLITSHGVIMFQLPANIEGVFKSMKADNSVPKRLKTKEQAAQVAWRIVKDWVEAQLAIVNADMASLTEVFLPYAQNSEGVTLFKAMESKGFPLLTHSN